LAGRAAGLREKPRDYWAQRFTDYQLALNRYFRRRVSHREDAEDLAQEVYLRLLRAEHSDGAIRNPEAYLYTVAVNLLRERAALARRRGENASLDTVEENLLSVEAVTEDDIDRASREKRITEIVLGLPPKFRAVIVMHYHHGLNYQEMAKYFGVTPHAIKKYVGQALRLCRRELRQGDQS